MIIYNSYIVAWYGLWLYFLLCLCVRVFIDYNKRKHSSRKKGHIHKFFFSQSEHIDKRLAKRILKYSKDDILFLYICECYFHLKKSKHCKISCEINILMDKIFNQKLRLASKDDALVRKLISEKMFILNEGN